MSLFQINLFFRQPKCFVQHDNLPMKKKSSQTHYDNLKVAQNASFEEIRHAYRQLSAKYHPDRNSNPQAVEIMQMINRAYTVLSDTQKRQEHDRWIVSQNHLSRTQAPIQQKKLGSRWLIWLTIFCATVVVGVLLLFFFWQPATLKPIVTQSSFAPNGTSWPIQAAYIDGYPLIKSTGTAVLTIDNRYGKHSIFMQLYVVSGKDGGAIRSFIVPQGDVFLLQKIHPKQRYVLRYMYLDNGFWHQSVAFEINQGFTYRLPE